MGVDRLGKCYGPKIWCWSAPVFSMTNLRPLTTATVMVIVAPVDVQTLIAYRVPISLLLCNQTKP